MAESSRLALVGAVAAVGVLHTVVPDHWMPIAVIARQRRWSRAETARTALQAGVGHVLSTLAIALLVWWAGVALAARVGRAVDTLASLALIAFGAWTAVSSWRELHGHSHAHDHEAPRRDEIKTRAALLLILGSSPMVEGIPAFFAAAKYGPALILLMSAVFALSTIATYVLLCVHSADGMRHLRLLALEEYGEVLSGAFIAGIGILFLAWGA